MGLPSHQFGRALANPFETFTSHEGAVVEEKSEQIQVLGTQLTTEEEVITQPGVEILYQRTGTRKCVSLPRSLLPAEKETCRKAGDKVGSSVASRWRKLAFFRAGGRRHEPGGGECGSVEQCQSVSDRAPEQRQGGRPAALRVRHAMDESVDISQLLAV